MNCPKIFSDFEFCHLKMSPSINNNTLYLSIMQTLEAEEDFLGQRGAVFEPVRARHHRAVHSCVLQLLVARPAWETTLIIFRE